MIIASAFVGFLFYSPGSNYPYLHLPVSCSTINILYELDKSCTANAQENRATGTAIAILLHVKRVLAVHASGKV